MKKIFSWILDSPIRFYLTTFLILIPLVAVLDYFYIKNWSDVLVEAHGLLFDILILGILFTIYTSIKERKDLESKLKDERDLKISRYLEEIDDFRTWSDKEAMYRIAGNIKRLNELGITKINLYNCKLKHINLRGMSLIGSYLTGADFGNGYLRGINLESAKLIGAYFGDSNLRGAILKNTDLERCKLQRANLQGADLQGSNCERTLFFDANLQNADLRNCDLKDAQFDGAILSSVRFEGAKNLTVDQLVVAKSLKSIRVAPELMEQIKQRKPELLLV